MRSCAICGAQCTSVTSVAHQTAPMWRWTGRRTTERDDVDAVDEGVTVSRLMSGWSWRRAGSEDSVRHQAQWKRPTAVPEWSEWKIDRGNRTWVTEAHFCKNPKKTKSPGSSAFSVVNEREICALGSLVGRRRRPHSLRRRFRKK
jgi:hypothetical protein